MKFIVPVPTNHNDTYNTYDTIQEARKAAYSAYGDVYVKLDIIKNNEITNLDEQIDDLIGALK